MTNHDNPAGTQGFAFLEFATPDPDALAQQFAALGLQRMATHKHDLAYVYGLNDIRFIINATPQSFASEFAKLHGPAPCGMGFKVNDAEAAYLHALEKGAHRFQQEEKGRLIYDVPAIVGVGGSAIYLIDDKNGTLNYEKHFTQESLNAANPSSGLTYIDHVTHNLHRGNLDVMANFYERVFNFREVRYFDIEGRMTGLKSRAMTSPCGKIRIPLNESSDDKSQIEEFLQLFNGEGIQHIALGSDNIYHTVASLTRHRLEFLETPDTYYELIEKRLPAHGEPLEILQQHRILIDGTTDTERRLLLQIFTKNMIGPVFFEIIQRKGDEGFGEGNFKALFESMELDQIKRGVLSR